LSDINAAIGDMAPFLSALHEEEKRLGIPRGLNSAIDNVEEQLTAPRPDIVMLRTRLKELADEGQAIQRNQGPKPLPAANVAGIGTLLYSHHLLPVELGGTLLLVATIGAIAITGRGPRRAARLPYRIPRPPPR